MIRKTFFVICICIGYLLISVDAFAHSKKSLERRLCKAAHDEALCLYAKKVLSDARLIDKKTILSEFRPKDKKKKKRSRFHRRMDAREKRAEHIAELLGHDHLVLGFAHLVTYESILHKAKETFGVDQFTIISILRVETNFCQFLGEKNPRPVNIFYNQYRQYEKKKKRDLAFRNFLSLLRYAHERNMKIFDIPGSIAGAIGCPQFMPESFEFAADGSGDDVIDLFNISDAIMSIARYLHDNGWSSKYTANARAIYWYNKPRTYFDDVQIFKNTLIAFHSIPKLS